MGFFENFQINDDFRRMYIDTHIIYMWCARIILAYGPLYTVHSTTYYIIHIILWILNVSLAHAFDVDYNNLFIPLFNALYTNGMSFPFHSLNLNSILTFNWFVFSFHLHLLLWSKFIFGISRQKNPWSWN